MEKRRFKEGAYDHVYQKTKKQYNIFYDTFDYLVYYTIFCVVATRMKVDVLGLCLMIDHIHMLIRAGNVRILSRFVSTVSAIFVREYNQAVGRKGPLFNERFGSAPKADRKKLIAAVIYLANNPVEKHLFPYPEQYRWNFLAYVDSPCPFSERIVLSKASMKFRKALKMVDCNHARGRYLNYSMLNMIFSGLTAVEQGQLTDYIISKYAVVDKTRLIKIFGSYDRMLQAMHSSTGSEYDLMEDYSKHPDTVYYDMIRYVKENVTPDVRKVTVLQPGEKLHLASRLKMFLSVQMWQCAKFLHL